MEFNIDWSLISGVLSGSLMTIVIKYFLEQKKDKTQHERELFKINYQRKLELAEAAIGFYNTYIYQVQIIKLSYQLINEYLEKFQSTDLSIDHIQKLIDDISIQSSSLFASEYININKVHLYFDLEDNDFTAQNNFMKGLDSIAQLKADDSLISWYLELMDDANKKNEPKNGEIYWNEILNLLPQYSQKLNLLIESLEFDFQEARHMVKKIKEQVQRF